MADNSYRLLAGAPRLIYRSADEMSFIPDVAQLREDSWVAALFVAEPALHALRRGTPTLRTQIEAKHEALWQKARDTETYVIDQGELQTMLFGEAVAASSWDRARKKGGITSGPKKTHKRYRARTAMSNAMVSTWAQNGIKLPFPEQALSGKLRTALGLSAQITKDRVITGSTTFNVPIMGLPGMVYAGGIADVIQRAAIGQKLAFTLLEHYLAKNSNVRYSECREFAATSGLLRDAYDPLLAMRLNLMRFLPHQLCEPSLMDREPSGKMLSMSHLRMPDSPYHADMPRCLAALAALEDACTQLQVMALWLPSYPVPGPLLQAMLVESRAAHTRAALRQSQSRAVRPKHTQQPSVPRVVRVGLLKHNTPEEKAEWFKNRAAEMRLARAAKREGRGLNVEALRGSVG